MSELLGRARMLAAGTALAVGIVAGCESHTAPNLPFESGHAENEDTVPGITPAESGILAGLPDSACKAPPVQIPKEEMTELARDCQDIQQDGRIAVVTFGGIDVQRTETMAQRVEHTLATATEGIITPELIIVPASDEAEQKVNKAAADGCLNSKDNAEYGSVLADSVMPELRSYDIILGVTGKIACNGVAGSSVASKGRHADLYDYAIDFHPQTDEAQKVRMRFNGDVNTSAHELLHDFGLGHYGGFEPASGTNLTQASNVNPAHFDLTDYLEAGTYNEYHLGDNIMGVVLTNAETIYCDSPLQTDRLSWPAQQLGEAEPAITVTAGQTITLDGKAAQQDKFVTVPLEAPLALTDSATSESTHGQTGTRLFNNLVAVPLAAGSDSDPFVSAVDLYLDDSRNIVNLGKLIMTGRGGSAQKQIKLGNGQLVTVSINAGSLNVTAA